jgi:hypothetical protein
MTDRVRSRTIAEITGSEPEPGTTSPNEAAPPLVDLKAGGGFIELEPLPPRGPRDRPGYPGFTER